MMMHWAHRDTINASRLQSNRWPELRAKQHPHTRQASLLGSLGGAADAAGEVEVTADVVGLEARQVEPIGDLFHAGAANGGQGPLAAEEAGGDEDVQFIDLARIDQRAK